MESSLPGPIEASEVFNAIMGDWGGEQKLDAENRKEFGSAVREWEAISSRSRAIIAYANKRFSKPPPIYFGLVASTQLNAFAFRNEGQYFIGVTVGALVRLRTTIARMLADKNVLTHVGDVSAEDDVLPTMTSDPVAELDLRSFAVAKDEQRRLFSQHIFSLVTDFITAHEFAHIANGHVALLDADDQQPLITEVRAIPGTLEGCLRSQTLEMDADACAACLGIELLLNCVKTKQRNFNTVRESVFNWTFAVCTFYRMFGNDTVSPSSRKRTHPPFRVRHLIFMSVLATYLIRELGEQEANECISQAASAAVAVEKAFVEITGLGDHRDLRTAWEGAALEYADDLQLHWKTELRSKLLPYAYGHLPD